ncbi:hypothetical protein CONPUDRAFT_78266 [Coniophora puteana RWD-64-598 SS2]|uniref:Uncharacterized protein n=1 Tax=Coniophora puteana (strain RWD-64-598) TaxID=741705 RepID=R7SE14_CONPW|nr:uncharacterized protein CONPUDRAFT_78266 [Coniophora puteana RWD-64-598 SS2]EIW74105.1 hypothetical protein CONPUDRAFT_78266 [Coniophora puteana RWD-64-598 SS2]
MKTLTESVLYLRKPTNLCKAKYNLSKFRYATPTLLENPNERPSNTSDKLVELLHEISIHKNSQAEWADFICQLCHELTDFQTHDGTEDLRITYIWDKTPDSSPYATTSPFTICFYSTSDHEDSVCCTLPQILLHFIGEYINIQENITGVVPLVKECISHIAFHQAPDATSGLILCTEAFRDAFEHVTATHPIQKGFHHPMTSLAKVPDGIFDRFRVAVALRCESFLGLTEESVPGLGGTNV